jgi:hypothetical protein
MLKSILAVLFGSILMAHAGLSRLEALSMLETGDRDSAVGGVGEVSRYQMRPSVWKQYSSSRAYHDPVVSRQVAGQHLDFLESNFRKLAGREPSEFDVYVLWNAGLGYYAKRDFSPARVSPVVRERAERYVNLRQIK